MINTLQPASAPGHDEQKGEVLERIHKQYGAPEQKQREAVKKLGKDEFFKIMVTQIQHQDPLKPYENEQMAAQLAQFSSLEQMLNVNSNLEKLAAAQQPLFNMSAANLIGKFVTADSSRIMHTEGKYSDITFNLPSDAKKARVLLINDRGETVRELELENLKKGENKIPWDGKKSNNFAAASGQYLMQVSAEAENGKPIPIQTSQTQVVHGVGFEGKETVLLTGDLKSPQKVLLKNVSKVIDGKDLQKGGASPMNMGGVQLGGLENLIKPEDAQAVANGGADGAAAAGAEGGGFPAGLQEAMQNMGQSMGMSSEQIAAMIDQQNQAVTGVTRGKESGYTPFSVEGFRRAQEKPEIIPTNPEDLKPIPRGEEDLTAANAAVEKMKAREMTQDGNSAGKSVQSSEAGSTAGQWAE